MSKKEQRILGLEEIGKLIKETEIVTEILKIQEVILS